MPTQTASLSPLALLRKQWAEPLAKGIELDSSDAISIHRKIIEAKPIMRWIYQQWYREFLPSVEATAHLQGLPMLEIGCGSSHLERYIPTVIKTDCVAHPNVGRVVDANSLPYEKESLRALFVLNALHHIEHPGKFLSEAQRCLAKGGRLVVVEPSNSPLQEFMIKHFHPYEYFDASVTDWTNTPQGRLSAANNALPWIIFERDRKRFEAEFPKLQILEQRRHTFLAYFASGGLSYRTFIPNVLLPLLAGWEKLCAVLVPSLGTEMTIVIEKRD